MHWFKNLKKGDSEMWKQKALWTKALQDAKFEYFPFTDVKYVTSLQPSLHWLLWCYAQTSLHSLRHIKATIFCELVWKVSIFKLDNYNLWLCLD